VGILAGKFRICFYDDIDQTTARYTLLPSGTEHHRDDPSAEGQQDAASLRANIYFKHIRARSNRFGDLNPAPAGPSGDAILWVATILGLRTLAWTFAP
jgi:hypothetical protein